MRSVITLLLLCSIPLAAQQPAPSAADLARDLQRRYEQVRDFSADFEHVYEGGVLEEEGDRARDAAREEAGHDAVDLHEPGEEGVRVGRPDALFVRARGPAGHRQPRCRPPTRPAARRCSWPARATSSAISRVVARRPSRRRRGDRGGVEARADERRSASTTGSSSWSIATSLQIRRLVTTDAQGGTSTFVFTKLRENVGLPDKAFAFTIPRGVDVITDSTRTVTAHALRLTTPTPYASRLTCAPSVFRCAVRFA